MNEKAGSRLGPSIVDIFALSNDKATKVESTSMVEPLTQATSSNPGMGVITSIRYPTRELAEFAVRQLVLKGVAPSAISIRDQNPPVGLNLGAGVLPRAINAIIREHDTYPRAEDGMGGYTVEVETAGGDLNEAISRSVFGYLA
jgi:hypothetical protein